MVISFKENGYMKSYSYTIYQSKAVVNLLSKWNKLIFEAKAF